MLGFVQSIRCSQSRLGTRKLHYLLQQQPDRVLHLSRDRLFELLRTQRLLVPRRRAYHKTTHSHHRFRRHPNLLKAGPEQVIASRPNQVWVADITYLPTRTGMSYVSLVTDAYSRKIVGHHVHESLRSEDVEKALHNALRQRTGKEPLIHHSDRGIQGVFNRSTQHLTFGGVYGATRRMDEDVDGAWDNAFARSAVTSS